MTDIRDQLARLLDDEPEAPYDMDSIVRSGRRARRRRGLALAAAGTAGAAGLTAAVIAPLAASGGDESSVRVATRPTPSPSASAGRCFIAAVPPHAVKQSLARLARTENLGEHPSVTRVKPHTHSGRLLLEVCTEGTTPKDLQAGQPDAGDQAPTGPRYHYDAQPAAIAAGFDAHLRQRVSDFGLAITFTRGFSQESSALEKGHPSYFDGNVDVHEDSGYADIGVQVTHEVTELVPFTGECTSDEDCVETKLPDGSVLRTGRVEAGKDNFLLTAEIHRPDGVVVQAQESNYPFGPAAGSQPHGDQPLSLDQLVSLAKDAAFTF